MYAEKAVVRVHRDLKVHTWFYPNPASDTTIILVNGSLATSAAFGQTLRYLQPLCNVVLFDQPYSGHSRPHNPSLPLISKEDEALILLDLIEHFRADQVMSFSWGGVATMLALAQRPARIRRAVVTSFSPILNPHMQDYLSRGRMHLAACDRQAVAMLINDTIGEYLPPLYKRCNFRHVSSLEEHEYSQMLFHVRQVLELDAGQYMSCVRNIDIPLLLSMAHGTSTPAQKTHAVSASWRAMRVLSALRIPGTFWRWSTRQRCRTRARRLQDLCWAIRPAPPDRNWRWLVELRDGRVPTRP